MIYLQKKKQKKVLKYEKEGKAMNLLYKSTRNADKTVTASEAILKGLADDGGLFVPVAVPKLDVTMDELKSMSYQETAYEVMKKFLTDFTEEELKHCINSAYDSKFDTEVIAPLVKVGDTYHLELFHGATIAFKDMALSILPHLMITSARKNQVKNDIVILTATSGDTGKAALAGFADVPGTKIIVFYPKGGVSRVQELQMVTQKGENTSVVAIHGNFDHAQSGVKALFEDKELEKNLQQKDISSPQPIRSISDVLFPRWFIMCMPMQSYLRMKKSRLARRSMLRFRPETLEIFLQHIMRSRWAFRSQS